MNIINLGKLIDTKNFESYISAAEELETVIHEYGGEFIVPNYPCWIEYKNEGKLIGSISFSRHTTKHPILKNLVKEIVDILSPIFPENYSPEDNRVHLIRTHGNIPVHKDEAGRLTCINIGLKNSAGAITYMGNSNLKEEFLTNNTAIRLQDGHGYLVNTNAYHSVNSINDEYRYLITYGLGVKYEYFKKFLRLDIPC